MGWGRREGQAAGGDGPGGAAGAVPRAGRAWTRGLQVDWVRVRVRVHAPAFEERVVDQSRAAEICADGVRGCSC